MNNYGSDQKFVLDAGLSAGVVMLKDYKYLLTKNRILFYCWSNDKYKYGFVQDICYNGMFYLEDSIKKEKPEGLKVFGNWPTIYHGLSELPDQVKKNGLHLIIFILIMFFNQFYLSYSIKTKKLWMKILSYLY